jgi:uncharacterized membrane protein YkvA (DUF1232 family)
MNLQKIWQENKSPLLLLLYLISPLDVLPEAFLGLIGLMDDAVVGVILVLVVIFKLGKWLIGKQTEQVQEKLTGKEATQKIGRVRVKDNK